jgi:outer membrane protein assembly factor BamB
MKQSNNPTAHLLQACPAWVEKLSAIHHDDLSFEERLEMRKHLENCANCQTVRAEYRAMDALITNLPPVVPLDAMPTRLQELTGMREELSRSLLADDAHDVQDEIQMPASKQLPRSHTRRAVRLNLAAAVLIVSALVAGFFVLHTSHSADLHTLISSPRHTNVALQHNTYLDVIIGNGRGDSYAIDPSSGSIVWKHQVMTEPSNNPFSANGILYYSGVNNVLYAIDGGNGQALWHTQLGPNNQNNGIGWNLAANNDLVFVTTSNYISNKSTLYALDAYTGAIVWQKHQQGSQQLSVLAVSNGVLYGESDGLYAWSARDGHQLWHNPQLTAQGSDSMISALAIVIANGKMYFFAAPQSPSGSGGSIKASHQIEVADVSTGHLLHTITINATAPQPLGFAVSGNILYAAMNNGTGTSSLQAYNLSDDHRIWQKTFTSERIVTLSATNDHVYIGMQGPKETKTKTGPTAAFALLALKGSDGSQIWLWSNSTSLTLAVAAVEINGVVCIVNGGVVGVRASDGHQLWQTAFSQATGFPPAID